MGRGQLGSQVLSRGVFGGFSVTGLLGKFYQIGTKVTNFFLNLQTDLNCELDFLNRELGTWTSL
jgi:hypothetical protein